MASLANVGQPNLLLIGGKVLTMDENESIVEAVAIRGNRIIAVGSSNELESLVGSETKVIDLKGRILIPGLIDSHTHPLIAAAKLLQLDCRAQDITEIKDLQRAVKEWAEKVGPGKWVRGSSYNDSKLKEKRQITRWELDEVSLNNPVYLTSDTGHQSVVNSLALNLAGITRDTIDPDGGKIDRDLNGEPTGLLYETAQNYISKQLSKYDVNELKLALKQVLQQYTEWGVTSTHDASATSEGIHCYQQLLREGFKQVRISLMVRIENPEKSLSILESIGIESGFGDDWLKIMSLKIMGDGSGAGGTSCVYSPQYRGPGGLGMWTTNPDEQERFVEKAQQLGIRVSIHAIGDRGIDAALDAIEKAQKSYPYVDMRHRIEHNSCCTVKQLNRIKELGVTPSSSVGYMYQLGDQYAENYGPERCSSLHPHRTMKNMGIVAGGNSDAPVAYYSPFVQIYTAVTRKSCSGQVVGPEESINVMDALRIYTWNGAYLSKEENVKGSIEPGKLADMVIIDRDILECSVEDIKETRVLATIVDGNIVYSNIF